MRSALVLGFFLAAAPAAAQPVRIDEAIARLSSSSQADVRTAIEQIGLSGNARGIQPLSDRIRRGLPPDLLALAVETLGVMARPEAGPILFELVNHRRSDIRLAAVNAIIAARPRGADRALLGALDDSDPRIRGIAATGIGQLGARDAIDSLFLALDRGTPEASSSIGRLATGNQVDRFLGYLGNVPFNTLTPGLSEVFARRDVPQQAKLTAVARLQELATPEVKAFLTELVATIPQANDPVRVAAETAIRTIPD